jgi:hypothetical protein
MTVSNGMYIQCFSQLLYFHILVMHTQEPGYYADGRFGIRIENVVVIRDVQTSNNFGEKGFLGVERLTMVGTY